MTFPLFQNQIYHHSAGRFQTDYFCILDYYILANEWL